MFANLLRSSEFLNHVGKDVENGEIQRQKNTQKPATFVVPFPQVDSRAIEHQHSPLFSCLCDNRETEKSWKTQQTITKNVREIAKEIGKKCFFKSETHSSSKTKEVSEKNICNFDLLCCTRMMISFFKGIEENQQEKN